MASSSKGKKKEKITDDCSICCTPYTAYLRKKIECLYCSHNACMACVKTYLITSISDPDCMSCHKSWGREFLDKNLTRSYCDNELRTHRQKILFDREKALLPETQNDVKIEIKNRQRQEEIRELNKERSKLKDELYKLNRRITGLLYSNEPANTNIVKKENNFIRGCPADGCRGFLESKWTCGICEIKVCSKCQNIKKDDEHVCNPDDIATAELLNRDSKPCPKCASMIFRISGCNMMFCIQCTVGFDWATGKIYENRNTFHNPEYTKWLANHNGGVAPRAEGDVLCGGLPHNITLQSFLRKMNSPSISKVLNIHRCVNHIQYEEFRRYPVGNFITDNKDLRIKYLLNDIDSKELQLKLESREKNVSKTRDIRNIYDMFVNVASDQLRDLLTKTTPIEVDIIVKLINELRIYTNESFSTISRRYKCVAPYITPDWFIQTSYYNIKMA